MMDQSDKVNGQGVGEEVCCSKSSHTTQFVLQQNLTKSIPTVQPIQKRKRQQLEFDVRTQTTKDNVSEDSVDLNKVKKAKSSEQVNQNEETDVLKKDTEKASSSKQSSRRSKGRSHNFPEIYGNYRGYYNYRQTSLTSKESQEIDSRLAILKPHYFKRKKVLDIGCHDGTITLQMAIIFGVKSMVGIEIDESLFKKACGLLKQRRQEIEQQFRKKLYQGNSALVGDKVESNSQGLQSQRKADQQKDGQSLCLEQNDEEQGDSEIDSKIDKDNQHFDNMQVDNKEEDKANKHEEQAIPNRMPSTFAELRGAKFLFTSSSSRFFQNL
eukprot:TRINITY_DN61_c0_g1_i7.p4 TRINITY_DN61_c0_g1~~TRINITY_DN61_c0_g1_i7.p4  ORF type:complete len:325 (-),score=39.29 TRINITY_DN61_c0_g1_i7:2191-3165(-)